MKLRTDFVTNSSSSSFVIAYKEFPNLDEDILNRYPFLRNINEMVEKILFSAGSSYDETTEGVLCKDEESFNKYFLDRYGSSQDTLETLFINSPYCKEDYEKIKETEYYQDYLDNLGPKKKKFFLDVLKYDNYHEFKKENPEY